MRQYSKNIILYIVALLGLLAFLLMFANSLQIYDSLKDTWVSFKVNAYLGDKAGDVTIYKGATLPIFGFVIPFLIAILLIVESFRHRWSGNIKVINTLAGILLFLCAIVVLLTKELFLSVNELGTTFLLRNGFGPIASAILSTISGAALLFVTWFPLKQDMQFIEKE